MCLPECDIKLLQKLVKPVCNIQRSFCGTLNTWCASVDDDTVWECRGHDKVMLDDEGSFLQVAHNPTPKEILLCHIHSTFIVNKLHRSIFPEYIPDDFSGNHPLLTVEASLHKISKVSSRFILANLLVRISQAYRRLIEQKNIGRLAKA